jgi:hypothetical protein
MRRDAPHATVRSALGKLQPFLYAVDFHILRGIGYVKADNVSLCQSHSHDEMLHLRAHVVNDSANVAQVLEHKICCLVDHICKLPDDWSRRARTLMEHHVAM